jgi:hypothetical protein
MRPRAMVRPEWAAQPLPRPYRACDVFDDQTQGVALGWHVPRRWRSPGLRGKIERLVLIETVSYDWNCPQYITPRFTEAEMEAHIAPLKARIAELETQAATRKG